MKLHYAFPGRWARAVAVGLVCGWGLSGCADMEHIGWVLVSSSKPALMQVAGQRLEGVVQLRPDRTGAIQVSGTGSVSSCAGSLRFTAVNAGTMDMRCSDGAMFAMRFTLVNEVKGYAYGSFQDAVVALTFGMDPSEAQAYLSPAPQRVPPKELPSTSTTP